MVAFRGYSCIIVWSHETIGTKTFLTVVLLLSVGQNKNIGAYTKICSHDLSIISLLELGEEAMNGVRKTFYKIKT